MSRCVSLTKKGDRCRNKALAGIDRCHIHAEKQSYAAPRVSDLLKTSSDFKPRVSDLKTSSDLKTKSLCDGKLCDGNKICNPATGRCVSLTGNIGQKLIQGNEVKFLKPEPKIQVKANKFPKPEPVKAIKILNPYLGIQVDPDEKDNCGSDRVTLDRIPKTSRNRGILSRYCDVLPLKDVKYIVGPNQYTEFRYKNYKIAIFGEGSHVIHDFPLPMSSKTNTLTFSAFLTSLVTQTKRQYDFFAELPYRNRVLKAREISDVNFMLNVLEYDFKDCLKVEKAACPYKNLRIHYSDARELYPERDNLAFQIYSYVYDYGDHVIKPPGDLVNRFLKTALKEYDEQTQFVERVLQDKTSKIEKQLRHNKLRKEITDFIQKQMQTNKLNFMAYLNQSSETINKDFTRETLTEEDIYNIRLLAYQFMYIFTPIMDTYLLGRIFRIYPNHSGGSAENIIIYGGSYHTELYISFLQHISANKTIKIVNKSPYYLEFWAELKVDSFLFNP